MRRVRLPYRPPYDWDAILAFLSARATPGVEAVDTHGYRRTIVIGQEAGTISIAHDRSSAGLTLRVTGISSVASVKRCVRQMFDLDADPAAIAARLGRDALLEPTLRAHPGIRVPGAWDPFELAVRAVLGQQVTVRAATTLSGRIAAAFGTPIDADGTLERLFPTPAQLAGADVERMGVMPARAVAIRALSRAVLDGRLVFSDGIDASAALVALPGIGPWTAAYIAMRVSGDRDALPHGDLVLRQVTGAATAPELERLSDRWRPWRSYATMLLWQSTIPPCASRIPRVGA